MTKVQVQAKYNKTEKGKKTHRKAQKKYQKTKKGKETQQKHQKTKKYKEKERKYRNTEKRKKQNREYQRSEKSKLKHRERKLERQYGITLEQYDQMFEQQNGVCAICGQIDITGRRLAVDHNHETGKIRSLLCAICNTRLSVLENKTWRPLAEKYLHDYSS